MACKNDFYKAFCFQAEREDKCYGPKEDSGNLNYSKLNCTQQLPFVCLSDNGWYKKQNNEIRINEISSKNNFKKSGNDKSDKIIFITCFQR